MGEFKIAKIMHTTPSGNHAPEDCPGGGPWPCSKPATDRTDVQRENKRTVRRAALDPVDVLVSVLQANGLTVVEACKAIRWATHVIEGREAQAAANTAATGMHYDDPVFERVTE